jgi:hypothetical protein
MGAFKIQAPGILDIYTIFHKRRTISYNISYAFTNRSINTWRISHQGVYDTMAIELHGFT